MRYKKCKTCANEGWGMPQCCECHPGNDYKWYRSKPTQELPAEDIHIKPLFTEKDLALPRHAPKTDARPKPPNTGSNAQKPVVRETLWSHNLDHLKAGALGDPGDPETMLRYWKEQEAAGYPGASENVRYFEDTVKTKDTVPDVLRTMAYRILKEIEDALRSNYEARKEHLEKNRDNREFLNLIEGKIAALRGISDYVEETLDQMLEEVKK